ncbi:Armadillo-like helical domain containing protein [Gracilaria domingensis]|nr:Armadillo-like helical domain containing protein [Gracilaria domingensis]
MVGEVDVKHKLRMAISPDIGVAMAALKDLAKAPEEIPSAALPVLLARVPVATQKVLALIFDILRQSSIHEAKAQIKKKINTFTASVRKTPPTTREALNLIKLSCVLLGRDRFEECSNSALDLLCAAIAAVEASPEVPSGPQHRSKQKAVHSAYRRGAASVSLNLEFCKTPLLKSAEGYAKLPYESLASLGLLASSYESFDGTERAQYLTAVANLCVKNVNLADNAVRSCSSVLEVADEALVSDKVIPILDHAVKRESKTTLPAALALLRWIRMKDVSKAASKTLIPTLHQAAKSSDEKMRAYAVHLAEELGYSVKSEDILLKIAVGQTDALRTARYGYQKISTVQSLAALICALPRSGAVYEKVLQDIRSLLSSKKEKSADVRIAGYQALVSVISKAQEQIGDSDVMQHGADLLAQCLRGTHGESDRKAVLFALTSDIPRSCLKESLRGEKPQDALEEIAAGGVTKSKQEDALRAFTILSVWSTDHNKNVPISFGTAADSALCDPKSSPVLQDPSNLSSMVEVRCALSCCCWMVRTKHKAADAALESIFKHCLDERAQVSNMALKRVREFQQSGDQETILRMLTALWNSQFISEAGESQMARSYTFDDGMRSSEKLGQTVLATVLPNIPMERLPIVVLAANHPRIYSTPTDLRPRQSSRFWISVSRKLEDVDTIYNPDAEEDWLGECLTFLLGNEGLLSANYALVKAAVNSVCALAQPSSSYSTRVLRHVTGNLETIVNGINELTETHFEALKFVKEVESSDLSTNTVSNASVNTSQKKLTKKHQTSTRKLSSQAKQAQVDKARAAAASATALNEKMRAARIQAEKAERALRHARALLMTLSDLAAVAPQGMHDMMSRALSLVLPLAKFEMLEEPCRRSISALTSTISRILKSVDDEIPGCLYGLERGQDVSSIVTKIVLFLQSIVPPALEAEDFACVLPIIQASLLRDPSRLEQSGLSRKVGATKRREEVAVVKAAAQVLLEHCKPEAVDAAVAAATSKAGLWILEVLEREDGAFTAAADALAFLTGTALSPGADALSQVYHGIVSGKSSVRDAVLASLTRLPPLSSTIDCPRDASLGRALWLTCFDPDDANAELSNELWENYNHPLNIHEDVLILMDLITRRESDVRIMAAKAIASALHGKETEITRNECLLRIFDTYTAHLPAQREDADSKTLSVKKGIPPALKRGRDRSDWEEAEDERWTAREGVALAIEHIALKKSLTPKETTIVFSFLAGRSLGDENKTVRDHMAKAAMAVVVAAGEHGPTLLLPMIEKQLNDSGTTSMTQDEILHADRTRENLVMCLGSVASFLPLDDDRVEKIARQVIKSALETPSEVVQNAAARCLAPLANAAISREGDQTLETLMKTVWSEASSYGERRGAAYSLAGLSTGLGLKFMKRLKVIDEIEAAVRDKSPRRRQGGFMLIETHAIMLGRLFEPYTVVIVPFLLSCMGDTVIEVRNACWAAAQASMAEISSQGVKMILPSLLTGLQERQWRTKAGSAEVLGAMAFCAPRQLAQCLPQVVPKLAEALADAHPKVVNAAESAVNRIAAVVRSPEVRKLSPFLLAALRDPSGRTRGAIDAMLGSEFVHAIDAASLALLIPPLHRGLRDRNSELKKRSAAIVGSMCNNVANHEDVVPYLHLLLPDLRTTLLDAIPDVRRTSARALGALAVSLGEHGLGDIVPWLVNALLGGSRNNTDGLSDRPKASGAIVSSSAERSGAAMGLAEISASMNDRRLEEVLSNVLNAGESSAEAREGGLMLIASMPRALGDRFEERLGTSLAAILKGLSDDADSVREAALEAGRNLVSAYAKTSLDNLLPELLSAMREKLWRIRQAATQLLGDMLLVIAGAKPENPDVFAANLAAENGAEEDGEENGSEEGDGEGNEEEDEEFESPEQAAAAMTTEATMRAIEEVLGTDRRNEVLAALYIIRCDVSVRVRQTGMQVWKSVVSNTPRVLREIMPCAVRQIVDGLGDEDEERRAASGRTLSDLSQKLGDRVVPEVLPALRSGICNKEASARIRRGACEGLGELVGASPKNQLEEYASDLIDTVYQALFDTLPVVRSVAAEVFSLLLKPLGTSVVDVIVPRVIEKLSSDSAEADTALESLKLILISSGPRLTSIVVPRLIATRPLQAAACKALSTAATVAQSGFEPYVSDVVDAVVDTLEEIDAGSETEAIENVLGAIANAGVETRKLVLDVLFAKYNEGYAERRIAASRAVQGFCRRSSPDVVSTAAVSLLEVLVRQLADSDEMAAKSSWEALSTLSEVVPSETLSGHIAVIRQSLRAAASGISADSSTAVTALQMPKAAAPFVPIFTTGLLGGSPELREQSALGIAELVEMSSTKGLGALVIKLAGEGSYSESVAGAAKEGRHDAAIVRAAAAKHVCEESVGQQPARSRKGVRGTRGAREHPEPAGAAAERAYQLEHKRSEQWGANCGAALAVAGFQAGQEAAGQRICWHGDEHRRGARRGQCGGARRGGAMPGGARRAVRQQQRVLRNTGRRSGQVHERRVRVRRAGELHRGDGLRVQERQAGGGGELGGRGALRGACVRRVRQRHLAAARGRVLGARQRGARGGAAGAQGRDRRGGGGAGAVRGERGGVRGRVQHGRARRGGARAAARGGAARRRRGRGARGAAARLRGRGGLAAGGAAAGAAGGAGRVGRGARVARSARWAFTA